MNSWTLAHQSINYANISFENSTLSQNSTYKQRHPEAKTKKRYAEDKNIQTSKHFKAYSSLLHIESEQSDADPKTEKAKKGNSHFSKPAIASTKSKKYICNSIVKDIKEKKEN